MPRKREITPDYIKKVQEYNKANYEKLTIMLPKGTKERWKTAAEERGESVTRLIIDSVEKEIN